MSPRLIIRVSAIAAVAMLGSGLGGCNLFGNRDLTTGSIAGNAKVVQAPTARDKDCLERAMYFESIKSDEDGLFAVGTVVMNRVDNPTHPNSICGVVGEPRQFAPGVLTRTVRDQDRESLNRVSSRLLAGERHRGVGQSLHFHTAGLRFPYGNMHYVALAGGNTFYVKTERSGRMPAKSPDAVVRLGSGALTSIRYAALSSGLTKPAPQVAVASSPLSLPLFARTSFTALTSH